MTDEHPNISTSRADAGDVARHSFGIVRRGFDPEEVRAYLEQLAKALEHADHREKELLKDLQEAEERARHPVIDESVLTASLGQRSAAVLRGAHEEAARILSQAEEAAASMVHEAQQQATDLQVNAESAAAERIAHAELEANSLEQQARDNAAAVVETARVEGEALVERAREQGREMLDQAQEARRRVLADMGHRRRLVAEQIELLRTARDEIAGSVVGVRRSLDRIVEELSHADESARATAAGASRAHTVDVPEHLLVEEAERAATELGELEGAVAGAPGREAGLHEDSSADSSRSPLRFDDVATVVTQPDAGDAGESVNGAEDRGAAGAVAAAREAGSATREAAFHDWQDDPALASPADRTVPAGAGVADPPAGGADVDGLFARLRARHATGLEDAAGAEGRSDAGGAPDVAPQTEDAAEAPSADDAGTAPTEPMPQDDESAEEPSEEPSPDAELFARRAEALDPIVSNLARRLKRSLQDDQNGLLDRLRKGTGEWSDALLADEASQRELYAKSANASLHDATSAGMVFAREVSGGRRAKTAAVDQAAVDAVAQELASTVVTMIRRRLETGDIPDAGERIGAAYREWRGERIERLAEDSVVEAFSKGVLAASAKRSVRWSRSQIGPGCADCEDNGLGGDVAAGEEFPTGHRHPPAHAGCRCLVVPTTS